jgi:hypothetical protein
MGYKFEDGLTDKARSAARDPLRATTQALLHAADAARRPR